MQKIYIEVKDDYLNNVFEMLHSLKGIMIEKINLDSSGKEKEIDKDLMHLQFGPMKKTWYNDEDEAWNAL